MSPRALPVVCLVFAALCAARGAAASGYDPPTPLLGERAGTLGGAFAAVADDATASFYNPAGLALLPSSVFGASLDVYELGVYEHGAAVRVTGRANALDETGLLTVPSTVAVAWSFGAPEGGGAAADEEGGGPFGIAFSVLVPQSERLSGDASIDEAPLAGGGTATATRAIDREDATWLVGPSFGARVTPWLSLGVSVFYELRLLDETDRSLAATAGGAVGDTLRTDVWDLSATRGALTGSVGALAALGDWRIGLTVYAPSLTLHDEARVYAAKGRGASTAEPDGAWDRETRVLGWTVRAPWRVRIGGAWRADRWIAALDVQVQLPAASYVPWRPPDGVALPVTRVRPRASADVMVGLGYRISDAFAVRGGAYVDLAGLEGPGDDPRAPAVRDRYGATTGVTWRDGATTLTLIVGYAWEQGEAPGVALAVDGAGVARRTRGERVEAHRVSFGLGGSYAF